MLTDTKLKNLKPKDKIYKVSDRDGLYVAVLTSGSVSFRYDYRINGRRETLVIGQYGRDGISLAEAREELISAKKLLKAGQSPAAAKRDGIKQSKNGDTFAVHTDRYMQHATLAPSTRELKRAIIDRDLIPVLGNKLMSEITTAMVLSMCDKIVERGGNATAVRAREIVSSVYRHANDRGHGFFNPAADIKPSSIATFQERERYLQPWEIGVFFRAMDKFGSTTTLKMALKLILLTMVRKSEFTNAKVEEVSFSKSVWTIPAERMKSGKPHAIYLSRQAHDLMVALQMCSAGSPYLIPGRYNFNKPMSSAALNSLIDRVLASINESGQKLEKFTVHDLRRTASTLLHEADYPPDWIEKGQARKMQGTRAVYNKAEYGRQRQYMLQHWADMVDAWIRGDHTDVVQFSPTMFEAWMKEDNSSRPLLHLLP